MNSSPGNQEGGGRPLSTADLAAAARRPNSAADANEVDANEADANEEAEARRAAREPSAAREPDAAREADAAVGKDAPKGRWYSERAGATPPADRATPAADRPPADEATRSGAELEPLFTPEMAETYRSRWISIQSGFVDDPRRAVRSGDELVAQIMTNLADTFAEERHRVEAQLDSTGEGSTEELRVSLRRYRSFFERLLSL